VGGAFGGLALLGAFGAGAGMTSADAPPGAIKATEFAIVDKDGNVRGRWGMRDGGVEISLIDTKGRTRIGLRVDDHPLIKLWGEQGENGVLLSQDARTGTWFSMSDQTGSSRLLMQGGTELTSFAMRDTAGKVRVYTFCEPDGRVKLQVKDDKEQTIWSAEPRPVDAKLNLK